MRTWWRKYGTPQLVVYLVGVVLVVAIYARGVDWDTPLIVQLVGCSNGIAPCK